MIQTRSWKTISVWLSTNITRVYGRYTVCGSWGCVSEIRGAFSSCLIPILQNFSRVAEWLNWIVVGFRDDHSRVRIRRAHFVLFRLKIDHFVILCDVSAFLWLFLFLFLIFERIFRRWQIVHSLKFTLSLPVNDLAFSPNPAADYHQLAIASQDVHIFNIVVSFWLKKCKFSSNFEQKL